MNQMIRAPTLTVSLPDAPPPWPFLYVDWNTVQHLRKKDTLAPLLAAVIQARLNHAALLPYSNAHVMDATADWIGLSLEHRAERFRDILFLDGLAAGVQWSVEMEDGSSVHRVFDDESVLRACESRAQFSTVRGSDDPTVVAADAEVQLLVASVTAGMRQRLEQAPVETRPTMEACIEALDAAFGAGLRDICETGRISTTVSAPVMQRLADLLPSFDHVVPHQAVLHLNGLLAALTPGLTFDDFIRLSSGCPQYHPDDYGPMMLGVFGYYRERSKDIRRGAPGLLPDQFHARHALASAIFITGDKRLSRRVAAWAAHTGRGHSHGTWPIILWVSPEEQGTIEVAAEVVNQFADAYIGRLEQPS